MTCSAHKEQYWTRKPTYHDRHMSDAPLIVGQRSIAERQSLAETFAHVTRFLRETATHASSISEQSQEVEQAIVHASVSLKFSLSASIPELKHWALPVGPACALVTGPDCDLVGSSKSGSQGQ